MLETFFPLRCSDSSCRCREFDAKPGDRFLESAYVKPVSDVPPAPFSANDFAVEGRK